MRATDAVWRTLADAALAERRSWSNTAAVAREAGVGEKLAYKAMLRPVEIGAVERYNGGGFAVTDPERMVMLLSTARSLRGARHTTLDAAKALVAGLPHYAIGGSRAAVYHLGGRNTIADHATAIVYVPEGTDLDALPAGAEALLFLAPAHTLKRWHGHATSKAQTYADLFAQPGWQASEFRRALWKAWFTVDDWSRAEEGVTAPPVPRGPARLTGTGPPASARPR